MILRNYQRQIDAGVPSNMRSVMIPLHGRVFDKRFDQNLREAIEKMDRPARRLVAV